MNTNASMYVRSYKARQGKEWKNGEARKVGEIAKKVQERRRNWCGHMMRREDLGRRVMEMEVQLREAEERRA